VGFETYDCTNATSPPECPANDCYEQAAGGDNNSYDQATPLGAGDPVEGVNCGIGDWDLFKIGAPIGCLIEVTASFEHAGGDIDTYLSTHYLASEANDFYSRYNLTDDFLIGDSITDDEHMSWVSRSNEPHYIRLVDKDGLDNHYTLRADVSCPPLSCPEDDVNEALGLADMGDNDTQSRATPTTVNDTIQGVLCGNDDWYTLSTVEFGGTCQPIAVLTFDPADALSLTLKEGVINPPFATVDTSQPGRIEVAWNANSILGAADFGISGPASAEYSLWASCAHLPTP